MKKIFALATALWLGAAAAQAQKPDGLSFAAEAGVGTEAEVGLRAEYKLEKWLSWDVLHAKYAYDYGDYAVHEITLTTGLRAFTPTFGPKLRGFAALDLGYGRMFKDGDGLNAFALDLTVGVQVTPKLYLGYGFGLLAKDGSHKDHLLRIGYNF